MFEKIKLWITINFILKNMSHEKKHNRDMIFKAISDSMGAEFNEDNCQTRVSSTVKWLMDNDKDFKKLCDKYGEGFIDNVAQCAKEGVKESFVCPPVMFNI